MKINFDGAVFSGENKSGIGVVIKDCSGSVLASCSKKIPHALTGSEAEALAAVTALSFATELGVNKAVLEGGSMEVILALTQTESTVSSIGPWIDDSKVLATDFVQLQYSHVRRECNRVAQARYAIDISDFFMQMEDILPQFAVIL